jgi:hypothetical protein
MFNFFYYFLFICLKNSIHTYCDLAAASATRMLNVRTSKQSPWDDTRAARGRIIVGDAADESVIHTGTNKINSLVKILLDRMLHYVLALTTICIFGHSARTKTACSKF